MTLGSPGGKAIISYVFKSLISILYSNSNIKEAIEGPNYIKIRGKIFIENDKLNKKLTTNGVKRNLTSGLGIIIKEKRKVYSWSRFEKRWNSKRKLINKFTNFK